MSGLLGQDAKAPVGDAGGSGSQDDGGAESLGPGISRSREIIKAEFPKSLGLVIVGLQHTIIAPSDNPEIAIGKFQKLIASLKQIDQNNPPLMGKKRIFAWIVDAGWGARVASANADMKLLQDCVKALDKQTAAWLAKRTAFAVAHARISWFECSAAPEFGIKQTSYQSSRHKRDATRFFRKINRRGPPRKDDAFTIFLSSNKGNNPTYFGHRAPPDDDWDQGPIGQSRASYSDIRNGVMRQIQNLLSPSDKSEFEARSLSKLFAEGFMIFSFEEFCKLDLN